MLIPPDLVLEDPAGRFRLRRWAAGDAEALAAAWSDREIDRWCGVPDERAVSDATRWIAEAGSGRPGAVDLVVADPVGDEVLGEVGVRPLVRPGAGRPDGDALELSWWLLPRARGRGLAVGAVRVLVAWVGEGAGAVPLVARIPADHVRSVRVATAVGLTEVGGLPDGRRLWAARVPRS